MKVKDTRVVITGPTKYGHVIQDHKRGVLARIFRRKTGVTVKFSRSADAGLLFHVQDCMKEMAAGRR